MCARIRVCVWEGVTSWKNDSATLPYSSHTAAVSTGLWNLQTATHYAPGCNNEQ